ncbi:hypothetical protein RugamoR57_07780 [Duganella caerulea]|uniref:Crp/Fnr family transcriptional regulator n=1 Tax=Duganella caerulea TaxID=2885762 RepID=UPI0030EA0537
MPDIVEQTPCARCPHPDLCLDPQGKLSLARQRVRVERNQPLYRVGDPVDHHIYSIRAGSFKLERPAPHRAGSQVIDFLLPPALLGLNEIGRDRHACSAIALEQSEVCRIRWGRAGGAHQQPSQRSAQHALLAAAIRRQQRVLLTQQAIRADTRLASLLLQLSQVHRDNGFSGNRFRLPMSRNDLASYLSVTPACVGRLFDQFAREGILTKDRREITLHCLASVAHLAKGRAARS